MENPKTAQPKKSKLRKIARNLVNVGKTVYEIMRDGRYTRVIPKDSRRAKHKRNLAIAKKIDPCNQRVEATLMRRIRQNLDDYLHAQSRISKKRKNKGVMRKQRKFLAANA